MMPADQVAHVTERARLAAVAEHRDRPVRQRLAQERRDRAAVVRAHATAVRVEDPHDRRVHALLAVVGHRQRLRVALGLVVHAARPDRVDVAPVGLRLRVHLRVAVHLARRGDQEPRALGLGQAERVMRAVGADLQRVQRQAQVVDRRGRRGQVVDEVDRLLDEVRLDDVRAEVHEPLGSRMCSMFASEPVSRLSTQITRCPRASSSSHRCEPRNPAPPVTRQVDIAQDTLRAAMTSAAPTRPTTSVRHDRPTKST